jgi:hypothetical protein
MAFGQANLRIRLTNAALAGFPRLIGIVANVVGYNKYIIH